MHRPTPREIASVTALVLVTLTTTILAVIGRPSGALAALSAGLVILGLMVILTNRARRHDMRAARATEAKRHRALQKQLRGLRRQLAATNSQVRVEGRSTRVAQRVHTHSIGTMRQQSRSQGESIDVLLARVDLALNTYGAGMEHLESRVTRLTETLLARVEALDEEVATLRTRVESDELLQSSLDPSTTAGPVPLAPAKQLEPTSL